MTKLQVAIYIVGMILVGSPILMRNVLKDVSFYDRLKHYTVPMGIGLIITGGCAAGNTPWFVMPLLFGGLIAIIRRAPAWGR